MCRLVEFPEGIYSLKELRTLQLNNNLITSLGDKIRHVPYFFPYLILLPVFCKILNCQTLIRIQFPILLTRSYLSLYVIEESVLALRN